MADTAEIKLPMASDVRAQQFQQKLSNVKVMVRDGLGSNPKRTKSISVPFLEEAVVQELVKWAKSFEWTLNYREYETTKHDYSDGESYPVTEYVVTVTRDD